LKIAGMSDCVHLDLDGAWGDVSDMPTREVRDWGRRLRYIARASEIERFFDEVVRALPPFVLYGSGDFHHLAGLLVRRMTEGVTVVSFDNHPDWDVRPPRWACGGWVSRALELPNVRQVSVWGCGNFELAFPARLFRNRSDRLKVHAWAERQAAATQRRFDCMTRENWRERFVSFVSGLEGTAVYVTVDMDCLRREEAVTNWENGLFTAEDVAWGIGELRNHARVIGGDLCGAWSEPVYARGFQRFAGWWDHPGENVKFVPSARAMNLASLRSIWPILAVV
jgi:arginase family enzyme